MLGIPASRDFYFSGFFGNEALPKQIGGLMATVTPLVLQDEVPLSALPNFTIGSKSREATAPKTF